MTEKAYKTTTYVQNPNLAEQLRETGSGKMIKVQQLKQHTTSSSSTPMLTRPNFDQRISIASATTHISSQAQSPVYGQQQWSPLPQPFFYTPEPNSYLARPLPDLPYAELSDTQSTDATPQPSPQHTRSPQLEYPAPLAPSKASSHSPAHGPASFFFYVTAIT